MNRRGFLSLLGFGAAGLVLDPERLLWVPGQKTIFLPPVVAHRNTRITGEMIAREWERLIRSKPQDNLFSSRFMFEQLSKPVWTDDPPRTIEVAYA